MSEKKRRVVAWMQGGLIREIYADGPVEVLIIDVDDIPEDDPKAISMVGTDGIPFDCYARIDEVGVNGEKPQPETTAFYFKSFENALEEGHD